MTEIPEHLLKRSKAARSKASGDAAPADGASDAPATAVAKVASAAPAAPVAPAAPAAPTVVADIPVVAAYKARKKVPVWAMLGLAILPVWGFMYARAMTPEEVVVAGPLGVGATSYGLCAGCHGAGGDGVAGGAYPFTNLASNKTFPHIEDQLRWVYLGSKPFIDANLIAGDPNREGGAHVAGARGVMPGQSSLTAAEILGAVCHERYTLGGGDESSEEFSKWCAIDSPAWVAVESGTSIPDLASAVDGALPIGDQAVAGTPAG